MRLMDNDEAIEAHEFPATSEELVEAYGDRTIELQNGDETLAEVLTRLGSETYGSPQDVYDAVYTGVSANAIGRRFYSDRDPTTLGEDGPEQLSF